jgi:hypothetical protein
MRYLKTQNLSKYGITDNRLSANPYGRYIMNGTGALRVPKGTSDERPQISNVKTPAGANGYIRYNTSIDPITNLPIGLEAYIDGEWEVVRGPSAASIVKQELGPGNYEEIYFGPLLRIPSSPDNILVLVENVFQISTTNFTLETNPPGLAKATYNNVIEGEPYPAGVYLRFNESVPLDKNVTIYFGFAD